VVTITFPSFPTMSHRDASSSEEGSWQCQHQSLFATLTATRIAPPWSAATHVALLRPSIARGKSNFHCISTTKDEERTAASGLWGYGGHAASGRNRRGDLKSWTAGASKRESHCPFLFRSRVIEMWSRPRLSDLCHNIPHTCMDCSCRRWLAPGYRDAIGQFLKSRGAYTANAKASEWKLQYLNSLLRVQFSAQSRVYTLQLTRSG
jgi:hypothetical protein